MKTISQLLLSLFAILLCLSCNTAHSQSLLQVVPADADVVALADVEKITSLAEASTADLIAALGGGSSSAIFEMLSSLVTNDTSLLHADRLWCIAATSHYEGAILAIEVNDAKGLKRYFKQQANSDNGIKFHQQADIFVCYDSHSALLSDGRVMIVAATDTSAESINYEKYLKLFSLDKNNSFASSKVAASLSECNGEWRVAVNGKNISDKTDSLVLPDNMFGIIDIESIKGKSIITISAVATSDESQKLLEEIGNGLTHINGSLLKYIPSSAAAVVISAVDGSALTATNEEAITNQKVAELLSDVDLLEGFNILETFAKVKGDFALFVDNIKSEDASTLPIMFICQTDDDSLLDTIRQNCDAQWQKKGNGYIGKVADMPLYISYNKGIFAASNYQNVTTLKAAKTPKHIALDNQSSLYTEMDLEATGEIFNEIFNTMSSPTVFTVATNQFNIKNIKINSSATTPCRLELNFSDDTSNLYRLLELK